MSIIILFALACEDKGQNCDIYTGRGNLISYNLIVMFDILLHFPIWLSYVHQALVRVPRQKNRILQGSILQHSVDASLYTY